MVLVAATVLRTQMAGCLAGKTGNQMVGCLADETADSRLAFALALLFKGLIEAKAGCY